MPTVEELQAEVTRLAAERDELRAIVDSECPVGALDVVTSLRAEQQHMNELITALHYALVRYGHHESYCFRTNGAPCECGLAEARALVPWPETAPVVEPGAAGGNNANQ